MDAFPQHSAPRLDADIVVNRRGEVAVFVPRLQCDATRFARTGPDEISFYTDNALAGVVAAPGQIADAVGQAAAILLVEMADGVIIREEHLTQAPSLPLQTGGSQ